MISACRTAEINERIILDVDWVPQKGGEARVAMQSFSTIAPNLPGVQGVVYDTALRGVHHQQLLHEIGWLPVNKVQASEVVAIDKKLRKRTEKVMHLEDRVIDGRAVKLFAKGGAVGIAEFNDAGKSSFVELKRLRTIRRANKNGTFSWYNELALPAGGTIMVRLDQSEEDTARKLNRTENARPIPPSDPDFARLYSRRSDIESINRGVEDSLYINRAHSKGHKRQLVNLLGYAIMVNGLALLLHHERATTVQAA